MNKWAPLLLLVLGLMQMTGDLLGVPALKGIGAASLASPAPRVFSAAKGLETYSTRFFLEWTDQEGQAHSLPLERNVYEKLRGPYNRRNAFGAVLAYGPVLRTTPATRPMFDAVLHYSLCDRAPLLREIGIDPGSIAGDLRIRFEPLKGTNMGDLPRVVEVRCK